MIGIKQAEKGSAATRKEFDGKPIGETPNLTVESHLTEIMIRRVSTKSVL